MPAEEAPGEVGQIGGGGGGGIAGGGRGLGPAERKCRRGQVNVHMLTKGTSVVLRHE